MSENTLLPGLTPFDAAKLDQLLGHKAPVVKCASPFLLSLARSFLLAPSPSDERTLLDDMVERVAAEEGVETEGMLRGVAVGLGTEGLL